MANDISRMMAEARAAAEAKARATNPSGTTKPGQVLGPGGQREGRNLGDRLMGESNYTAGFPGYNNEAGYNDRQASYAARGQQQELGTAIQDRALGRGGPSVAELQMQRGMNQGQQQIAQRAASGRGMNRGGAQMAAIRGASDLYANTNEQTGIMRAQEQIAAQQLAQTGARDMRQQDLLSRGYSIEEAKAILDAQLRVQEINAGLASGDAQRAQGPAMMGVAAAGGLLSSDARSKDIMYSDFADKDPVFGPEPTILTEPARADRLAPSQPEPPVRAAPGYQPMLQVAPTAAADSTAEEQRRSLGEQVMASASGSQGGSDLGQSAATGFSIGSALGGLMSDMRSKELMPSDFTGKEMRKARAGSGSTFDISGERAGRMASFEIDDARRKETQRRERDGGWSYLRHARERVVPGIEGQQPMSSDFRGKEPTMGELDQVGKDAMLPFREMDEQESRDALAPVDPVVYRYKEGPSARMANEEADRADLRAKYAGLPGGASPEEEQGIRQGTFQDKREPRLGIVAQQLQQSPDFRQSVVSTPAGLAVQRDRALSTALGSLAGLDKRMRELEDLGDSKAGEIRGESTKKSRERRLLESRY